ncbi:23S rRNA (uracil(1939)-C(5))-methyltransferase RlmD [Enterococcus songbeiensis]|uniref:23S rRNA (uracil(1939)-C(5))-methyltransferase RlmD n=1 Tax=Enterococcus songbeiensis TaxID=2559927 RepID=UPI0010F86DB9|nr:23S rRNA (uracil(1939)-C(5))-methyltransferase RlmD [Enterococcus songbeiensis]
MKDYPIKKNEQHTVEIIDLTHEGMGIAKFDHYPVFIENALPGEKVRIKILKVGPKFGFGKISEWLEKSPDRQEVVNEELLRTGIAPLSHLSYEQQLLFKQKQVKNLLQRVAKLPDVPVLDTIGMAVPSHYRNKAQIPVKKIDGKLQTGFYRKNSHDLVPIEDFYIQDPAIDAAIITVREILQRFNVKAYNEEAHEGFLRHIVIRRGHYSHQMMVVLVTKKEKFFKGKEIASVIHDEIPDVVSVIQNINEEKTNVIMGEKEVILYGQAYIEDQLLGNTYRISAKSFYQVNTQQTELLYQTAIDFADLQKDDIVVDAYSGIGTIGLSVAKRVAHVYGMETIESAVADAKYNAEKNGIDNATYLVGKAEKVMQQWAREDVNPTVIFVDPPRKGLEPKFIEAASDVAPEKIIYISCNPATLARDLALFAEKGYETKKIQPIDLFPQTYHVESVSLLTRVEK